MADKEERVRIPTKEELLGEVETKEDEEVVDEEQEEGGHEEVDPILEKAISMGYNPEGVEGKRNLSPEEFVDRQKLYDDIRNLKKQNKKLAGDVNNLTKYQDRIREDERKQVMEELRRDKIQALKDEDYDKVADIDDKIADERSKSAATESNENSENSPEFDSWVEDNQWYNKDVDLKVEADMLGEKYWRANPEKDIEEVFEYVGKTIRKLNPDKFENEGRRKPSAVEGGGRRPAKKPKEDKNTLKASDLSPEEQSIMRTIVRTTKGMTEEKYLEEYQKMSS